MTVPGAAGTRREPGEPRLPRGYWPAERVRAILDKTLTTRFAPDLSGLSRAERQVVHELVAAGRLVQDLAEDQNHHQALRARRSLVALHGRLGSPRRTADLLDLYELSDGPIATTLDNQLLPFLPVDGFTDGKNVYPWGIEAAEVEEFLERHPGLRGPILDEHTAVRRTSPSALRRDLATLRRHPVLAALHPGLGERLEALLGAPGDETLYAVPYSVAWPALVLGISDRLSRAGLAIAGEDGDLAAYLRQRSRDLLADDNEAGDAAWVRGRFGPLDAVIGAHEVYGDDLFGAKTFFGLTILLRDHAGTEEIRARMRHLQAIEDALPCDDHRTVDREIPIGSFDVVAAFGAGRRVGAEILPNDPNLIRKYGRKIALRRNLFFEPRGFARLKDRWMAGIVPEQHEHLTPSGSFQQVIWHEIGHYLGPDVDAHGRSFETTLGEDGSIIEELKADLASQFAASWLHRAGQLSDAQLREHVAGGVLSSLRPARPLRTQPYLALWLMELNFFLEHGALELHDDRVAIRYERHPAAVELMLREVLAIQRHGERRESSAFIERHSAWDERHERLAARLRAVERYRFLDARYGVLDA